MLSGLDSTLKTGLNTGASAFTDLRAGAAGSNTVTGCTRAYGLIRGDDATTTTWGAPPNNITIVVNDNLGLTDSASATHNVPGGTTTITVNDHLGLTDTGAPQTVVHTVSITDNVGLTDNATPSGSVAGSRLPVFRAAASLDSGGSTGSAGFTIAVPATAQVGDFAVIYVQLDRSTTGASCSSPSGAWTAQFGVGAGEFFCYTYTLQASDLGHNITVGWTWGGSGHWSAMVACWSSCSGGIVVPGTPGSATAITLPPVATVWDQTLLAGIAGVTQASNASTGWTLPAGWTAEATLSDTTDDHMIVCADNAGVPTSAYTIAPAETFTAPFAGSTLGVAIALAGSPAALDVTSSTALPVHYLFGSAVTSLAAGTGAWPQIVTQALFGQGPNDPSPALVWTDMSARTKSASITRGAPYELAQATAGSGQLLLDNADGAVDPSNTSSPYWPNVQIMCRVHQFVILGGQVFPVWGAYVYGWATTWHHDLYGDVQASLVDALATLQAGLLPVIASAMLTSSPTHLWPFAESYPDPIVGAAPVTWTFVDEGSDPLPLTLSLVYPNGTGYTATSDASLPLRNDDAQPADSSQGIRFTGPTGTTQQDCVFGTDAEESLVPLPGQVVTWELFGIEWTATSISSPTYWLCVNDGTTEWFSIRVPVSGPTSSPQINMHDSSGGSYQQSVPITMVAGQANHLVVTIDATNAQPLVTVYGNGVLMFTAVTPVAFPGQPITNLSLAGNSLAIGSEGDAQIIAAAMYQRYLSPAEIADHWAAYTGYSGDTTGVRAERVLDWGGWNGPAIIDPGTSTMQGVGVGGSTIADTLQQIVDTEFGLQYVDASGNLVIAGRARIAGSLTPLAVFGDGGGSEIPYEGDIGFSLDANYVYDRVQVARNNGVTVPVRTPATTELVFGNTLTKTIYSDTDEDAFSQAAYLAGVYALPSIRLAQITIDMLALITQDGNAGTSLTQTLLGLDILSVVTVTRRGVSTSTGQYRIEQISDQTTPDSWTRAYQLAPLQPAPAWGIPGDYTDTYGSAY